MTGERLICLAEAARMIGCSYSCVLKWRKHGKLSDAVAIENGRRNIVMLPSSSVERLRDEFQKRNGMKKEGK